MKVDGLLTEVVSIRWWRRQSERMFSPLVGPRGYAASWSSSHSVAGREHVANRQVPSRMSQHRIGVPLGLTTTKVGGLEHLSGDLGLDPGPLNVQRRGVVEQLLPAIRRRLQLQT